MIQENKSIYVPYMLVCKSTQINGVTVWYKNKFLNFLLKVKFLFVKRPTLDKINTPLKGKYYETIGKIL